MILSHHDELVKIDKNELNGLDFDYVELMRSISHQHIASVVELPSASDDQLLLAFHIDSVNENKKKKKRINFNAVALIIKNIINFIVQITEC